MQNTLHLPFVADEVRLHQSTENWCRQISQDQKVRSRRLGLQDPCELAHQVAEHSAKYDRDGGDEERIVVGGG